jgi:hypothetical protein
LLPRLQRGEDDVRPCKQLRDRRGDIGETFRINDRRRGRPGDPDDRGHAVGFDQVDFKLAQLLPDTPFAPLVTVPGWGAVCAADYAPPSVILTAGWEPASSTGPLACRLRSRSRPENVMTAGISREGSVPLRRALIDLGIGMWHADPGARR